MKDLSSSSSSFLFKNSIGAKMKKSFKTFCNGDNSTSTLNQHNNPTIINPDDHGYYDDHCDIHHDHDDHDFSCMPAPRPSSPYFTKNDHPQSRKTASSTLEEMILQLEIEEERARREKQNDAIRGRRMSCVNNSDILRSARNALNQYPRFSLDGKDAMYRSSFRNAENNYFVSTSRNAAFLPPNYGGESVIWCKPGVIAKLMGLEAMPMPINNNKLMGKKDGGMKNVLRRQNLMRRAERHENETRIALDNYLRNKNFDGARRGNSNNMGSCSKKPGYCPVKPATANGSGGVGGDGWPTRRFH